MEKSISVMVISSQQIYTIDLPSEKGGDMITIKEFIPKIEEQLSISCSKLMVGKRRVDLTPDVDRSVHFFLLLNSLWHVHTADKTTDNISVHAWGNMCLFISHNGRSTEVSISSDASGKTLRKIIEKKMGIPAYSFWLNCGGKPVNDRRLSDNGNIRDGCKIILMPSLCGGGASVIPSSCAVPSPGVRFADIAEKSSPKVIKWSKVAPAWRKAKPGLCLEGKCTNKKCKAYKCPVIMNLGYREFDFINESNMCMCPLCNEAVEATICAFNNCLWKIIARKYITHKHPEKIETEWKEVGDEYHRFSPEKHGMANFLDLIILCKPEDHPICFACGQIIEQDELQTAPCGHSYHEGNCYDSHAEKFCITCIGNNNMTPYQMLFV